MRGNNNDSTFRYKIINEKKSVILAVKWLAGLNNIRC